MARLSHLKPRSQGAIAKPRLMCPFGFLLVRNRWVPLVQISFMSISQGSPSVLPKGSWRDRHPTSSGAVPAPQ